MNVDYRPVMNIQVQSSTVKNNKLSIRFLRKV
jgi:hypothetical protein